jgi:hypothetical protein
MMFELLGVVLLGTVDELPDIVPSDGRVVTTVQTDIRTGVELMAELDDFVTELFEVAFVVQENLSNRAVAIVMLSLDIVSILGTKQDFKVVAVADSFEFKQTAD